MGFTIPKKIPKKKRDTVSVSSSLLPPPPNNIQPQSRASFSHQPSSHSSSRPAQIKRKHSAGSSGPSRDSPSQHSHDPDSHVQITCFNPLLVKIKLEGVPLTNGGIPSSAPTHRRLHSSSRSASPKPPSNSPPGGSLRSSSRTPKKRRKVRDEDLEDTDSDELMNTSEEEEAERKRMKRIAKKKQKQAESTSPEEGEEEEFFDGGGTNLAQMEGAELHGGNIYDIESPPPGELNCLWYSREPFLHVFVLEKILGWKTRPVARLETCDSDDNKDEIQPEEALPLAAKLKKMHTLEADEAIQMKDKAIADVRNDFRKRMEISRLNPAGCSTVKKFAARRETALAKREGRPPKFKAVVSDTESEEVFLIKWRGRSHMHCSWERKHDLERFDHSTQLGSARGKISRYIQTQVMTHGADWKKVLEDGRSAASTPATHHHSHNPQNNGVDNGDATKALTGDVSNNTAKAENAPDEEDYFSPLYLEVDRILGCDESELDMQVLARQRALNIRAERKALQKREEEDAEEEKWLKGEADAVPSDKHELAPSEKVLEQEDAAWDPEDNVRYVVKWKGLQLTEATWEYWVDIKRDFVDEVEDFWMRQRAPSSEEVKQISNTPHPHPKNFKKLTESPVFGVSSFERKVAILNDGQDDIIDGDAEPAAEMRLRVYQLEGVNWLLWNWYNQRSCILADEMGLGKTIQSIGFLQSLQRLHDSKIRGPFLIVAPLSLVSQWESECKEWAPDMNVVIYHGNADSRNFLVNQEFYYTDQFESKSTALNLRRRHITKFHILITTYEVVLKDANVLAKIKWRALLVDEAHRLKNVKSRLFEDLASVPREFCLLLTGTPLQNSTEELWALLHFCDPVSFASKDDFTAKFGQLTDADQVANLHTVLRPYLLRRVKEDVEKSLPPKEETILEVSLTPIQKTFYKAIYEKNTSFLFKGTKPSNAPSLMNVMMELRKCCNHPFLINGAEERIINDAASSEYKSVSEKPERHSPIDYAKLTGEQLVKSSGKFVLLAKLLPKLHSGGHKVLIFSQMVRVLDLLQELLQLKHYKYERLDGSTSASARNAAVDRFKRESFQRFVMLLSTRAGGLGLNLTVADTVIIFDSDWNPQNDLQAMARAHRIGQTRSVRVYRLLTSKTYEMHMFHSASLKLGLDRAVLAAQRQNASSEEGSSKRKSKAEREEQAKEIDELLKKGAYDVFRDDDDKEAQKFMETDIDQLLEQSSRKVTYGETATSSLSSGLGSFSKASFVASTADGDGKDVDLDDPDFWAKAVGLEAPPEDMDPDLALIIGDGSKRNRKQVKTFDPQADLAEAERKKQEEIARQKELEREEKELQRLARFLEQEEAREEREKKERDRKEAFALIEKQQKEKKDVVLEKEKKFAILKEKHDAKAKALQEEKERRMKQVKIVFNSRKTDRKRALKRAEHEDPLFERVKQAWDTTQRTRMINAILRFGFGRFCKVRQDSNFTSLPIQDVEVFSRAYVYQLGLQAASTLLANINSHESHDNNVEEALKNSLQNMLGVIGKGPEFDWICEAILAALCMHMRMKSQDAFVRIPLILAEPAFVFELRNGVAIRSLHRLSFMSRLNGVIEEAIDRIISDLGYEEMGKRGCPTNDYSTLDVDLKARHVSIEEIMHALGINLISPESGGHRFKTIASESFLTRAPWWDRSCDLGLLVGTFFHGIGNYEAMRVDEQLPFVNRMNHYVKYNRSAAESFRRFEVSATAAKVVFDNALISMKRKFQQQTHAAVAAVFAAKKKAENLENAQDDAPIDIKSAYLAKTQKLDDDDIVTLPRLKQAAIEAFRKPVGDISSLVATHTESRRGPGGREIQVSSPYCLLPLPDSNHLDHLLMHIVNDIETNRQQVYRSHQSLGANMQTNPTSGLSMTTVFKSTEVFQEVQARLYGIRKDTVPNSQVPTRALFPGGLSAGDKRSHDDSADYFLGAASPDLAGIAVGADSSRYQRGPCVPLVVTRFGLGAILFADDAVIDLVIKDCTEKPKKKAAEIDSSKIVPNCNRNGQGEVSGNSEVTSPNNTEHLKSEEETKVEIGVRQQEEETQGGASNVVDKLGDINDSSEDKHSNGVSTYKPLIMQFIKDDTTIRSSLCSTILLCGCPSLSKSKLFCDLSSELIDAFQQNPYLENLSPDSRIRFVSMSDICRYSSQASDIDWSGKEQSAIEYVQNSLLPHCLRLCVMLSSEQAKTASIEGKTDLYLSRSSKNTLSIIPDPFIPFEDHSEEAVANAFIILRRKKLMESIRFIAGGGIPFQKLTEFLHGPVMRKHMTGVPVWWCPWIHDLLLLVHAALLGLTSVVAELPISLRPLIEKHIRDIFVNGVNGKKPALPSSFLNNSSKEDLDAWVHTHAKQFPTPNIIEHRLALICSQLTVGTSAQYDDVPMFDEGGWPMVEDSSAHSFIGDTKSSGGTCLLRDFEHPNSSTSTY